MWTANLFQITTGNIGPRVSYKNASWSLNLNEQETLSIEVSKSDIPLVDRAYWLAPWWAGVLFSWNGVPIFAGPIIAVPSEDFQYIRLECKGIRALLERRFVINELVGQWDQLSRDVIVWEGYSLGTIAQKAVKKAMEKQGGSLPIAFPIAEVAATKDDSHKRTYEGYNLSNVTCNDILTKLSGVINGPDIMFKPIVVNDSQLYWEMWYGTEDSPTVPQTFTPVWDSTAVSSAVVGMEMTSTGAYQASRVFAMGEGTNQKSLIKVATDVIPLTKGFPLLEIVENFSDVKTDEVLQGHADASLKQNNTAVVEINATVRADGEHRLGTYWPGWDCVLVVGGWMMLSDGDHRARILALSGDDSTNVKMTLQTIG